MNKLKLLVATICLIGCTGAASDLQNEGKFTAYREKLVAAIPCVAQKELQNLKLAKLVKFFAEPLTVLIKSGEFERAYDTFHEKALENSLRNLIFSPKSYEIIFSHKLYKDITTRLNVVTEDKKHGVLWVYLNELNYLYWN